MSIRRAPEPGVPGDTGSDTSSVTARSRSLAVGLAGAVALVSVMSLTAHASPGGDDTGAEPKIASTSSTPAPTTTAPTSTSSSTSTSTSTTTTTAATSTSSTSTSSTSTSTTTTEPVTEPTVVADEDDPGLPGGNRVTVSTTTTTTTPPAATIPDTPREPTARDVRVLPEQIQHILATIRYLESRGIYTLPPNKGDASGAYQYIGSTWNGYAGYSAAYLAPPEVQDERAASDVERILAEYDNDVSMVPVIWYLPAAVREPWRMDVVPSPENGNILTIREYQTRWLSVFSFMSGQPLERILPQIPSVPAELRSGRPPEVPEPHGDVRTVAFPVLGPSRVAVPDCDGAEQVEAAEVDGDVTESPGPTLADIRAAGLCTPQAPGIVFGVKLQPVMAIADGIVTDVIDDPDSGEPITVTVTDVSGTSYVYAGFNDDSPGTDDGDAPSHLRLTALAQVGGQVRAGQIIGFMGDTDPLPLGVRADVPTDSTVTIDPDAVAPHIRITMVDVAGRPVDAFGPIVDALFRQTCTVGIGQWSVPANGSGLGTTTIETTDLHDDIDSEWVITSTGQVTAAGWAAMINPNEGCGYAPADPHGPGEAGSDQGLVHWLTPVDLPTPIWVRLAMQDEFTAPGGLLRPG